MASKKNNSNTIATGIMMSPIIFAIALIPLIVRFTIYNPTLSQYSWFSTLTQEGDIFMVAKQSAMFVLDALLILGILQLALTNELPKLKIFLLLAVYALMIILSTFVSVSPYHSLHGFTGMMESVAVLLGYCGICYYTYGVIKTEKQVKIVMFSLFISIIILCGIGLTQMFGTDILMSDFGKSILFPPEYAAFKDSMVKTIAAVSSTLFNPNYVGIYSCMIIPILLTLAFTVKKKIHFILYGVLLALATCALVGAGSKTAILTLAPCLLFLIIYFIRQMGKKAIPLVAATLVIVVGLTVYQGNNSLLATVISRLQMGYTPDVVYDLEDVILNDKDYIIKYKGKNLSVSYDIAGADYKLIIKDENNQPLSVKLNEENGLYVLEDPFYGSLVFQALTANNKQIGFVLHSQGCKYNICYSPTDNTYYYLNNYGKYTKLSKGEIFDFPLFHVMGGFSGRDYIWQRSIPILKQTLFLGSGPDTYALMFPQYDYIAGAQNGYANLIVTKPHNTYLQIGIQTGVISLLAYMGFYLLYFIDCVKLYLKRTLNTFAERCGAGIFVGSFCFMFAGLLHDSTIGVSVVFWTLIGLGLVCNRIVKEASRLPVDDILWKKKCPASHIWVGLLVVCTIAVAGYAVTDSIVKDPIDGRTIFKTSAIGYVSDGQNAGNSIPFQASMPTEWNFMDGSSASANARVTNKVENNRPISFDVCLESGELIYSSDIIPVGRQTDFITLSKPLAKGTYTAIVTYHLLDNNYKEVAVAQIPIAINVLN